MEKTSDIEKRRAEILELLKLKAEWLAGIPKKENKEEKVEETEKEEEQGLEDFEEARDGQRRYRGHREEHRVPAHRSAYRHRGPETGKYQPGREVTL